MWHQINIHTSEANKEIVRKLTTKLPVGTKENVIARIALGHSIQTGKKFSSGEFNKYDSKGKEYKDHILFDPKYRDFYIALICQHYEISKTDNNIPKYIKLHIDHGLEIIGNLFESNDKYTFFDFLTENLEKGISALENVEINLGAVKNNNQKFLKNSFSSLIKFNVGNDLNTGEKIILNFNDTSIYNNQHIAVAGNSGSGKTQFALDLLMQIHKESNGQVNYIYLDFKGLKDEDVNFLKPFFKETQTNYIDAPQTAFPLNPLKFIDNINEKNKIMGINKFVDIITKYSNIGKRQAQKLKDATKEAFNDETSGEYPSITDIKEKLFEDYGEKRDTLTEIMDSLSELEVFEKKSKGCFLTTNTYLSLSGDLPNSVRFTSLFLIINYIYNTFMNMENAPVENGVQAMRYVILIDEAHVIFKEKKYQEILERILREIRSKGVSVVLLSQGIEEFNQPSFDFSSMCNIAFLLDVNNKNMKMIKKFLGFSDKEENKIKSSMSKIEKGQAISNINEFEKGKLFKLKQFKDR